MDRNNPLSNIIRDGGMMNIFLNMGCIGDSLSSGEFEYDKYGEKGYWDFYEYSWGKQIERITGIQVTNFSRGGLTAQGIYELADKRNCSDKEDINHLFDADHAKQGYIIALGVNDINQIVRGDIYGGVMGNVETDICLEDYEQNAKTLVGYYAKIIQRLKTIQPDAKFFLVTMPDAPGMPKRAEFADMIHQMAAKLTNCYVIDLYHDAPTYDGEFYDIYFDGHMNCMGYLMTAYFMMTYIDWIIRHNPDDFRYVPFIGQPYKPYMGPPTDRIC